MQHLVKGQLWDLQSDEFVIAVALLGFIFVIGVAGNGAVVAIITLLRRRGQKSSVQLFLLHLAISDLMVCLLCIPLTFFTNFHYPTEYHTRDSGLCKLARFMQQISPVMSVSLLTAISVDRYMTFARQEFTCSQRSWYLKPPWLIFFAWVYGTGQNLPIFHSVDVIPINITNGTIYYCSTTQGNTSSTRIQLVASLLLGFVIPLATMIISYVCIMRVIWTRNRRLSSSVNLESGNTITNAKLLDRSRKKVLRVLLIVVICFITCWLPFAIYHGILERYLKEPPNPMDAVRLITYGVGLVNSMCNPFIYYFNVGGKSCRSMKKGFIEVLGGRGKAPRQDSVPTTTTPISSSSDHRMSKVNMVELSFDPNKIICLNTNSTEDNCVEGAHTNDAVQGSQDEITMTRL